MKRLESRLAAFAWPPGETGGLDAWERRGASAFGALPYFMLVFSTIATVVIRSTGRQSWLPDLGLCALAGAWLAVGHLLRRKWGERGWAGAVFFTGLVIVMGILVYRDPWFGFFTFTGYFYVMCLPVGWPMVAGVVAIATLCGTSQTGGVPAHGGGTLFIWLAVVGVNVLVAGAFMWFGWVTQTQNEKRKTLVDELSATNQRLEATLAENAGLHRQLLTQAREAGILDERQRLAREIHDTLAQGLTGIITQLQAAEHATGDPVARRRHFDAATRLARESLTEARRSVDALRPQPLERAPLSDALIAVAGRWSALHDVPAQVTVTGTACPMAAETESALLRTAQEALANVAKHAGASRVGLTLSYMGEEVALDVRDDGRGFDAARALRDPVRPRPAGPAPAPGGFGLVAMRERIEALSGTLQVESEPGTGTAVSACVPFHPAQAPAQVPAHVPAGPAQLAGARR